MESTSPFYSLVPEVKYSPPWQDLSIIGIAGSSGSGKTSVAMEIVKSLNLPWVVILVMVCILVVYLLAYLELLTSKRPNRIRSTRP
jgi:pantothenate kinase-related protein Tda10